MLIHKFAPVRLRLITAMADPGNFSTVEDSPPL
jgi:hypothetical protein